jgi:hypothetical protein
MLVGMPISRQIDLTPDHDPWDRQDGESERHYRWYTAYQNQGRARRVRDLAHTLGKSDAYLKRVAWGYRWNERAQAWDAEQDRLHAELLVEERQNATKDQLQLARSMLKKVAAAIEDLDAQAMSPADIARWVDILTKVQRAALGDPDRVLAVQGGPAGAPPIQVTAVPVDDAERLGMLRATITRLAGNDTALEEIDPADFEEDA